MSEQSDPRPTTLDEAVRTLLACWSPQERARIAAMTADDLVMMHFEVGSGIRNYFGLWTDNKALMAACGVNDADDASDAILRAAWQHLRSQ